MKRVWNIMWSVSTWFGIGYIALLAVAGAVFLVVTQFWLSLFAIVLIIGITILIVHVLARFGISIDLDAINEKLKLNTVGRVIKTILGIIALPFVLVIIPVLFVDWNLHIACIIAWQYFTTKVPITDRIVIFGIVAMVLLIAIISLCQTLGDVRKSITRINKDLDEIKRKL